MKNASDGLFVAGIGTSADGIEALETLLSHLPGNEKSADRGIAYVIVNSRGMIRKPILLSLLSSAARRKITEVTSDQSLSPNEVYILPSEYDISLTSDKLILGERIGDDASLSPSIDRFLTLLADEKGDQAIGIILAGTDEDGVHGMHAVKAAGGITVMQDPQCTKSGALPEAIIDRVGVDLVLTPEQMGKEIFKIINTPMISNSSQRIEMSGDEMNRLMELLHNHTGCNFSEYKESTLHRRVARRMALHKFQNLRLYIAFIEKHPEELKLLAQDILISVTRFFRDMEAFKQLGGILPDIFNSKKTGTLRVWVPGCASGEEVYSLAILFAEFQKKTRMKRNIQFFATDIDTEAVMRARKAVYPESSLRHLDPHLVETYFEQASSMRRVVKSIRENIVFARQDIVSDPPFSRIDLIACRNLMIYFNSSLQSRLLAMFHYALNPDGFLFLGKSEFLGPLSHMFTPISKKWRIFKRNKGDKQYAISFRRHPGQTYQSKRMSTQITEKNPPSLEEVFHRAMSESFEFPSVLVNERLELLYVRGDITPFFRIGEGNAGLNIYDLARAQIRSNLRASIHKAIREKVPVVTKRISLEQEKNGASEWISIHVRPLFYKDAPEGSILIFFERELTTCCHELVLPPIKDLRDQHIIDLEQELAETREHLQNTVEELETANEELHSLNEELQSINEELETSNEELQATNEELITVNEALQVKGVELSDAITEGKKAEAELLRRKELFKAIVDHAPVLITLQDLDGNITLVNQAFENAVGWRNSDLGEINLLEQCYPDPLYREEVMEHMQQSGAQWREFSMTTLKNTMMDTLWTSVHLDDGTRIAIGLDVTEKKKLESILGKKERLESLGNLAGGIAHDFNNCLASIIGYAELSLDLNMEREDCGSQLTQVIKSGMRARDLVRRILTFSQKAPFKKEPIAIKEIASEAVKMLRPTLPQSIKIETHFPDDELILLADASQIHQIVTNLVANATHAIEESERNGEINVLIEHILTHRFPNERLKKLKNGDYFRLSVSDNGVGIAEDLLEKLFDPYFTTKKMGYGAGGGSGLGLSVVHGIVKSLKGEIVVENRLGSGATFHVYLPLMEVRRNEKIGRSISDETSTPLAVGEKSCGSILFVDDETAITTLQNIMLKRLGYAVSPFTDSVEALVCFQKNPNAFDIVITDMEMPKMRGDQLTSEIKKMRPDIPVILCTGHSEKLFCSQKSTLGFDACLIKPVEKKALVDAIRKFMLKRPSLYESPYGC